ncbi:hypothetical protein AE923_08855 [Xanthomonas arboricola]|nr:hypothetical protein AE923_08855 [Xanthomonas arboricola]
MDLRRQRRLQAAWSPWCGFAAPACGHGHLQTTCGHSERVGHLVWICAGSGVCRRPAAMANCKPRARSWSEMQE